ncbi:hypothetical protein DNTS_013511 [Danionella cerebrum]|uniref:Uncharacterized protein n=1 Tax=Danionella cerebrum TaxID=2873325 RepID=A0A553RMX6_9TELE|nr:hypothetical protein DNTS_013511 [Danionella translucida]
MCREGTEKSGMGNTGRHRVKSPKWDILVQEVNLLFDVMRNQFMSDFELWTPLVQVQNGLYGQWSTAFSPIEGEVPALAAGFLTLEPQGASEEYTQSTGGLMLSERTLLRGNNRSAIIIITPLAEKHTVRDTKIPALPDSHQC